jgi:hypothetical protein
VNAKRALLLILATIVASCGPSQPAGPHVTRDPISVRGWIADVEGGSSSSTFHTVETEAGRKTQLFQATNVWVDNAPYVSGGVAADGAFILLDVPPGNVTIEFTAPGAERARLVLRNIPGNADVFVPAMLLRNGDVELLDKASVKVRLAAAVKKASQAGVASVAGQTIPVMTTPIADMADRHDYPNPPASNAPLAVVK